MMSQVRRNARKSRRKSPKTADIADDTNEEQAPDHTPGRINATALEQVRQANLERIRKANAKFDAKRPTRSRVVKQRARDLDVTKTRFLSDECVGDDDDHAVPQVSVNQLLLALSNYSDRLPVVDEGAKALERCVSRHRSTYEILWSSSTYILRGLRQCVFERNWRNMTHLLILLLYRDKKYLIVARNMCRLMIKFNPMIKMCELEEQFAVLTAATDANNTNGAIDIC